MGVGGPGNPGLWMEIPKQGLSFLICKKGGRVGWASWRCLPALAFVILSLSIKKVNVCVRVFTWVGDTAFVTSEAKL